MPGAVDLDGTTRGPGLGLQMSGQEADKWQMLSIGTTASAHGMPDAVPYHAAEQQGEGPNRRVRLRRLRPSTVVSTAATGELFSSQLERFLSLLLQADSRSVGSNVGHRIQLADCRLAVDGELGSWADAVYRHLTAILQQTDPWEQQLPTEDSLGKMGKEALREFSGVGWAASVLFYEKGDSWVPGYKVC